VPHFVQRGTRRHRVAAAVVTALAVGLSVFFLSTASQDNASATAITTTTTPVTSGARVPTATTPATEPATTSTIIAPSAALSDALSAALLPYTNGRSDDVSVAVYDASTDTTWASDDETYETASIIKLSILEAVVLRAQREERDLTTTEKSLATQMIATSDNDAATALWNSIGGAAAITDFYAELGATHTTVASSWGLTTTSASDQLLVLRAYAYENSLLTDNSRALVANYLQKVVNSQHWGVSSGPDSASAVELKNGWLQRAGGWDIHSRMVRDLGST
jgi:hypothetical protein